MYVREEECWSHEAGQSPAGPPNQLQVLLICARRLKIADKNLFGSGGSSDPVVTLSCDGASCKSAVVHKNLNPEWMELLELDVDRPSPLTVKVEEL